MRVVIADDEVLIQHGLVTLLEQQGFTVIAAVSDARQLRAAVERSVPDLVITDIRMPPDFRDEGLHEAIYLRSMYPKLAVVVLSQHVQRRHAARLIADAGSFETSEGERRAGVGYLLKQRVGQVASFCEDLRRVAAGATVLDPEVAAVLAARAKRAGSVIVPGGGTLTSRQLEVLELMSRGLSNAKIAEVLVLTEGAVVKHVSGIYAALQLADTSDAHRRVQAVARFLSQ